MQDVPEGCHSAFCMSPRLLPVSGNRSEAVRNKRMFVYFGVSGIGWAQRSVGYGPVLGKE